MPAEYRKAFRSFLHGHRALVVALAAAMLFVQACSGEFTVVPGSPESRGIEAGTPVIEGASTPEITRAETEFAAGFGEVRELYFAGAPVTVVEVDGHYVYEGDILLPADLISVEPVELTYIEDLPLEEQRDRVRLAARTSSNLWPNNTIYYSIDEALPGRERVTAAIAHWEANTNVRFIERTSESNYVDFVAGGGCSSYVGRVGGRQPITLASACSTGNVIHEIGHAAGAWHEHSRADRDASVIINWDNIHTGAYHNFQTYAAQGYDGADLTPSLDFDSIMMYSAYSFSINGLPTIVKLDGSTFSAQRSGLSAGDVAGLSIIYPSEEIPEETGSPDMGSPDTGSPDMGSPDTGSPDMGSPDTGSPDMGGIDSGSPDMGGIDSGSPDMGTDSGSPDTGTPDVGGTDSGGSPDTGGTDTGGTTEPEYVEGEYYVIAGLRVLYEGGSWFFYSKNHWREVVLVDGRWYYTRGHSKPLN